MLKFLQVNNIKLRTFRFLINTVVEVINYIYICNTIRSVTLQYYITTIHYDISKYVIGYLYLTATSHYSAVTPLASFSLNCSLSDSILLHPLASFFH